jgi:hypothetical protein
LLVVVPALGVCAADKIRDAIAKGEVTKEFVSTLTPDDVPAKWRTSVVTNITDNYIQKIFSRGGQRRLEIQWRLEWVGVKSNMFSATVFDGAKRITALVNIGEATSIKTPSNRQYDLITTVKNDGSVSALINGDAGFYEMIEVRGRDTRLVNDLEYTRTAIFFEGINRARKETADEKRAEPAK